MERCAERIQRGFQSFACKRRGTTEEAGKFYCKTHNPNVRAEKKAARDAKWDAEREAEKAADQNYKCAIREAALREAETAILALRNDATGILRYAVLNEAANVIASVIDQEPKP